MSLLSTRVTETFRHTSGWDVEPYADRSAAFVFVRNPVSVMVLDKFTWYLLEICDGRSRAVIDERVAGVLRSASADHRRSLVDTQLQMLVNHGLISGPS